MEIVLLDSDYQREELVETYHSCIWTEQYTGTGNFELAVPATDELYSALAPGRHLANSKSPEIGTILRRQVKDNQIIVSGPFQLGLFKYRVYRYNNDHEIRYGDFAGSPGDLIEHQVTWCCMPWTYGTPAQPNPDRNVITNLVFGSIDKTPPDTEFAVRYGQLLDIVLQIAKEGNAGIRLRVEYPTIGTYQLVLDVYYGKDKTSGQSTYPAVVFSPALDNLAKPEEFFSMETYFNVCYAYAPNIPAADVGGNFVVGDVDNAPDARDWERRVMMVFADDLTTDEFGGSHTLLRDKLRQRARDALANNNYVRLADGEIVPQIGYNYGEDNEYYLGDLITLQNQYGTNQTAQVTEFIRSMDQTGYKEYPTLSIVD